MHDDWDGYSSVSVQDHFATAVESLEYARHEAEIYTRLISKHIEKYRERLACHDPITNIGSLDGVMEWAEKQTTLASEMLRDVDRVLSALGRG